MSEGCLKTGGEEEAMGNDEDGEKSAEQRPSVSLQFRPNFERNQIFTRQGTPSGHLHVYSKHLLIKT